MWRFSSPTGVFLTWVGVSVGLWGWSALQSRRDRRLRRELIAQAGECVNQAHAVFDSIRDGAPDAACSGARRSGSGFHRETISRTLSRIQEHAGYFEGVSALGAKICGYPKLGDHPALAEILQIRRDLWGAANVALVEDLRKLGDAFAAESAYERFRAEAASLLFKAAPHAGGDPIGLRLSLAREEAARFAARVEEEICAREERERLPTRAELTARASAVIRTVLRGWGAVRSCSAAAFGRANAVALAIRESRSVTGAIGGTRRLGSGAASLGRSLSGRLSAAVGRIPAAARHGVQKLRALGMPAKGREFVARLELARRTRLFSPKAGRWRARLRASGYPGAARRGLGRGVALVTSGVQTLQRRFGAE
jgi:hypothetical protein